MPGNTESSTPESIIKLAALCKLCRNCSSAFSSRGKAHCRLLTCRKAASWLRTPVSCKAYPSAICQKEHSYLDISMHQILVHAMGPAGNSVSIPCILKVVRSSFERILEHHVVVRCIACMDGHIDVIIKHPIDKSTAVSSTSANTKQLCSYTAALMITIHIEEGAAYMSARQQSTEEGAAYVSARQQSTL